MKTLLFLLVSVNLYATPNAELGKTYAIVGEYKLSGISCDDSGFYLTKELALEVKREDLFFLQFTSVCGTDDKIWVELLVQARVQDEVSVLQKYLDSKSGQNLGGIPIEFSSVKTFAGFIKIRGGTLDDSDKWTFNTQWSARVFTGSRNYLDFQTVVDQLSSIFNTPKSSDFVSEFKQLLTPNDFETFQSVLSSSNAFVGDLKINILTDDDKKEDLMAPPWVLRDCRSTSSKFCDSDL